MKIKYRIDLKVGYNHAYFDFDDANTATEFAVNILKYSTGCDDTAKVVKVNMQIVNEQEQEGEADE